MRKILLLILILILIPTNIYADETMQARVVSYYKHPVSGVIEDPGNNMEIGQGMTQTVIDSKATIQSQNGSLYAIVKFNLANHISNISLGSQERNQSGFNHVSYEILDKNEETMDLKFPLSSKTAIMRASFFVEPMGRDVIFYFDFSNFKTISSQTEQAQDNQAKNIQTPSSQSDNQNLQTMSQNLVSQDNQAGVGENINQEDTSANPNSTEIVINVQDELDKSNEDMSTKNQDVAQKNEKADALSSENIGYDHGLLMKGSEQLQNYYSMKNDGNNSNSENKNINDAMGKEQVEDMDSSLNNGHEMGEFTKFMIKITIIFMLIIAVILFIIALIMYIIAKTLRQINLREEEKLYD